MSPITFNDHYVQDETSYQGCSFYLISRINKTSWECLLHRPFLLHNEPDSISGQFVSTMWFNQQIKHEDTVELIVLRLPQRSGRIHPNEYFTQQLIVECLKNSESNRIHFEELDFVVLYKKWSPRDTQSMLDTYDVNTMTHIKHHYKSELSNQRDFGLSFNIVTQRETTHTTNDITQIYISCPSFRITV